MRAATAGSTQPIEQAAAKTSSIRALNALNFFLADVQGGVGPFLVVYLTAQLHWTPSMIGLAMGISGVVGVIAQIPVGAWVDSSQHKRFVMIAACCAIVVATLLMGHFQSPFAITLGQSFIALAGAIFGPCVAAISLGLVGRKLLDRQVGRNQTFNSAGNIVNAVALGLCGYYSARQGIFWFVASISVVAIFCVYKIKRDDIDNGLARGSDRDTQDVTPDGEPGAEAEPDAHHVTPILHLFKDRRLLIFGACAIVFHFANAGLGPMVSQIVAKDVGNSAMLYQSALTIVSQLMFTALGWWVGKRASGSLRKPLYLVAFAILPVRAILYLLTRDPSYLLAIQLLDGIGGGMFGIMQLLVIADLTKGTGRFNVSQGALGTAVGIGASLSNIVVGYLVKTWGFNLGFEVMAGISMVSLLFFWRFMPETKLGHTNLVNSNQKNDYYLA